MKIKILTIGFLLLIFSCNKDDQNSVMIKKELLTGYIQKGPYINGSSITISELDNDLNQTGRSYYTSVINNTGKFEQKNIELTSYYTFLRADGFYFNEILGEKSSAQLTLNAIADISEENSVNVNILTHLENSRIEYLVSEQEYDFNSAKAQAQQEILKIFSIEKLNIGYSENLSLTEVGDGNAILFAISAIIQGYRTTADMSELLANIITDIKMDGQLNDSKIGSNLIDDAKLLVLSDIRSNIEKRYKDLGISINVPDFEKYVNHFIDNTDYKPIKFIDYPEISNYGINILHDSIIKVECVKGKEPIPIYSMAADLPVGTSLIIVLKGGIWYYRVDPDGPINWTVSQYNFNNESQTFKATVSGQSCDLNIEFYGPDTLAIEYYENNSVLPTKTKEVLVE